MVQGCPAVLVLPCFCLDTPCSCQALLLLPLAHSTFILHPKALQSPVSTMLPWACSSVGWQQLGLTAPPKLPSPTSCSPIAFWTGKTPGSPTCSQCILIPMPAYTTLSSTTLWVQQSMTLLGHNAPSLNTDRNRNLAKILILCVPGSFFWRVQWPSRKMRVSGACQEACGLGKLYPSLHGCSVTRLQFHQWHHSQGAHFKPWPFAFSCLPF